MYVGKSNYKSPPRARRRGRRAARPCRCCGQQMEPTQVWICAACEMAGRTIPRKRETPSGEQLLAIAQARVAKKEPPLGGWKMDEVAALAWYLWQRGARAYGSYGKLKAYADATGKLPPIPGEEEPNGEDTVSI